MPSELQVEKDSSSEQTLTVILKMPIPKLPMRLQKVGTSKTRDVYFISHTGSTDYTGTHFKEFNLYVGSYTSYITTRDILTSAFTI